MFPVRVDDSLLLGLLEERHADELFRVADRDRIYLRQWLPWLDATRTAGDTAQFIRITQQQFESQEAVTAGLWVDGALSGTISLQKIDWANRNASIGYWLAKNHQGRGVMTRCCRSMVDTAFRGYGLHRVEIRCATENARSCAIPERLGFAREGLVREVQWLYDRFVSQIVYGKLASEWP